MAETIREFPLQNGEDANANAPVLARRASLRGFASMDKDKQREIARKGGRAAHMKGTAHEFTSDEARQAGRKGGEAVSRDRAHMAAIGREGGQARGLRAAALRQQAITQPDGLANVHHISDRRSTTAPVAEGEVVQTDRDYKQGNAM